MSGGYGYGVKCHFNYVDFDKNPLKSLNGVKQITPSLICTFCIFLV